MAIFHEYNREAAVSYARRWALGRNPAYMDYEFCVFSLLFPITYL